MNYGIYLNNKIQNRKFNISEIFQQFPKNRKCFGIDGVFCAINRYFEYRIRILYISLYMGT